MAWGGGDDKGIAGQGSCGMPREAAGISVRYSARRLTERLKMPTFAVPFNSHSSPHRRWFGLRHRAGAFPEMPQINHPLSRPWRTRGLGFIATSIRANCKPASALYPLAADCSRESGIDRCMLRAYPLRYFYTTTEAHHAY